MTNDPAPPADETPEELVLFARHRVRTPENVTFDYALAGLGARFGAWTVDQIASAALVFVGLVLVTAAQGTSLRETRVGFGGGLVGVLGLLVVFGAQWAYFVVSEWALGGQTFGKRLLRLRVIGVEGVRVTFAQSVARNLLRMIDAFPVAALIEGVHPLLHLVPLFVLPGAVCAWLSPRSQRLGDIAAGTLVVEERSRPAPGTIVPPTERYNRFLADRQVASAIHRHLAPAEADALVTLCLRRDQLEMGRRLALFHSASTALEARLGVARPPELSEEKFVLNLVAVLLGAKAGDVGAVTPTRQRLTPGN